MLVQTKTCFSGYKRPGARLPCKHCAGLQKTLCRHIGAEPLTQLDMTREERGRSCKQQCKAFDWHGSSSRAPCRSHPARVREGPSVGARLWAAAWFLVQVSSRSGATRTAAECTCTSTSSDEKCILCRDGWNVLISERLNGHKRRCSSEQPCKKSQHEEKRVFYLKPNAGLKITSTRNKEGRSAQ